MSLIDDIAYSKWYSKVKESELIVNSKEAMEWKLEI